MNRIRQLIHEIHRRSLWQVLGIYAVSSWVVYQVVLGVWEGVGLPDWVPSVALLLLLVGLPIVLATAFVQEGRSPDAVPPDLPVSDPATAGLRPSDAAPRPADPRARAFFTWPRAITGGVLAFALLGLASTGFMGMRAAGVGPWASLVSTGVLEEREPVLLAEFTSGSGDSIMAAVLTAALRVDLESSPAISLVQTARVQAALTRMRRDPAARLDQALASEVALREGIRAVLVGDVTAAGSQYVLTARLVDPHGAALASVRETAAGDAVIQAADRLSAELRKRLGESTKSVRASEPLAQVTTASLEALRKYSQGTLAYDADPEGEKAIALLREAVALDSTFAMAWRKLGVAYYETDELDSARVAMTHAFAHRERLTDRERYLTEGTYYDLVRQDTARAMVAYETLLDLHPDEPTALNNLGRLHTMSGNLERGAELYGRRNALDSYSVTSLRNEAGTLARLRRYDAIEPVLEAWGRTFPEDPQVPLYAAGVAAARFDYATARELSERAYELSDGDVNQSLRFSLDLLRGRHADALRIAREGTAGGGEAAAEADVFNRAFIKGAQLGDMAGAAAELEAYFTAARLRSKPVGERPYFPLVQLNALARRADRAAHWLAEWRAAEPAAFAPPTGDAERAILEVAAARGDAAPLAEWHRTAGARNCQMCWFELGLLHEAAGRPDSAIVAFETFVEPPRPPILRVHNDAWFLAPAYRRLGMLHEQAGNREAARGYYARFIELWEGADAPLQPQVEAARQALVRLAGEGR